MSRKGISFLAIACASISNVFASSLASPGYYDIPNDNNEVLGLTNMNKEFNITSLMNSAIINDYKAVEIFLNTGANVNDVNMANVTALHLASRNASHETAQILLRYGAVVDPIDQEGWTPLMRACLAGDLEMIKILMGYGANAWAQNNDGNTPIVLATMADCYPCVKYILENGGKAPYPSLLSTQLQNALDIANKRYNEPLIKLLKDALNDLNGYGKNSGSLLNSDDNLNPYDSNLNNKNNGRYIVDSTGTIVELIYIFMGRTISASEIQAMGQQAYLNSMSSYYDRTPMTRSQVRCSKELGNCKKVVLTDTTKFYSKPRTETQTITIKKSNNKDKQQYKFNNNHTNNNLNNNSYNNKVYKLNNANSNYNNVNYNGSSKTVYTLQTGCKMCVVEISGRTENAYKNTAIHEMGHLFGWNGHSSNSSDIMYGYATEITTLTTRDKTHLKQIYTLFY